MVSEFSCLPRTPFKQIFPDSCDEGMVLVSHVTGEETVWYCDEYHYNDSELEYVTLKPTPETLRKNIQLNGWVVIICND